MKRSGGTSYSHQQRSDHRVVPGHGIEAPDENKSVVRIDVALVVFCELDVILNPLVGRHAPDEQEIHEPIVQDVVQGGNRIGCGERRRVDSDRHDTRVDETELLQLATVVLGVSQREIHASGERGQFLTPEDASRKRAGSYGAKNSRA